MKSTILEELPLRWTTPGLWAEVVLRDPLPLLNDHAHLEKKAGLNALELLGRWPDPTPPQNWIEVMTAVARDEVDHLATVTRLLARRGGVYHKHHKNPYANDLRNLVRLGLGPEELMDRLLVSALIEARSCERFYLLGQYAQDAELRDLYADLYASEAGHYRVFLQQAQALVTVRDVDARWDTLLDAEARIIQVQPPGPRMHSGVVEHA
jgi:tRNA-(ms[2]io[6]A)-hydroxylase